MLRRPKVKATGRTQTEPASVESASIDSASDNVAVESSSEIITAEDSSCETPVPPQPKVKHHHHIVIKKPRKRSTWLIFTFGGLAGLLLAGVAANNQDMVNLQLLRELNFDSIIDVIPVGILKEASDISQREKEAINYDAFSAGLALKAEGLNVEHPVIMVRLVK